MILVIVAAGSFLWTARSTDDDGSEPPGTGNTAQTAGLPPPRAPVGAHRRSLRWASGPRQTVHLGGAEAVAVPGGALGYLEGQVLSTTTAAAVAGAELSFALGDELHAATADEQGRFRFEPLKSGVYELAVVSATGYLPFAPEWGHSPLVFAALPGRAIRGATIYLNPAAEYYGRVLDPEGKPVEGAMVVRLGASPSAQTLARLPRHFRSNDQGWFRFVAPDNAVLEARREPFAPGRAAVDFAVQVSRVMTIRLGEPGPTPEGLQVIAGRVVGPDDGGVPDALVVARFDPSRPADPATSLNAGGRAVADEEGMFEIHGLDPGRYTVIASSSGLAAAARQQVQAPTEGLTLRLGTGGALTGRVRQASDQSPVPAFTVVITRASGPLTREVITAESTFDAEGYYEIPALPTGEVGVTVSARGFAPPPMRTVRIDEGARARADFALDTGGTIVGRVLDADSRAALAGARISLETAVGQGAGALPVRIGTSSDDEGKFSLTGVSPGERTLLVAATGHHGKIVSRLAVVAGQQTGPIEVALSPTEGDELPRIELAGIGAVLSADEGALVIGRLVEGGGAADAGLVVGDAIVAVEGIPVVELGFAGSVDRIRGPEGTTVTLTIRSGDDPATRTVVVIRKRIRA
jgi:hypothetical protein